MRKYYCECSIEYDDDSIVVDAKNRREAIKKAKEIAISQLEDINNYVRCRCYTEKELERMF